MQYCKQRTQCAQRSPLRLSPRLGASKKQPIAYCFSVLLRNAGFPRIVDFVKQPGARQRRTLALREFHKAKATRETKFLAKRAGSTSVSGFKRRQIDNGTPIDSHPDSHLMDFPL